MIAAAYYNEIDPYAAEWLRNLIKAGHIAPGEVDERSIEDVRPDDLRGFAQCHFFAGIGVWSLALRRAGVADSARVWTGSCPCQPFSAAGKGDGFADERHLWPAWLHLISQCEPERIYGEQVASRDADPWIDLVCADMEALGYAFGAVPFPSAGVGASHIRDRLYWVADADRQRRDREHALLFGSEPGRVAQDCIEVARRGKDGGVAHAHGSGRERWRSGQASDGRDTARSQPERLRDARGLADAIEGERGRRADDGALLRDREAAGRDEIASDSERGGCIGEPGPVNGFWRAADWLACRDGRWRPVEPGTFPLAHGAPARVGRLRAYGNAINAVQAEIFVRATL